MAEAEYTTTAKLPIATIWDFVQDMDNWAHLLTGYQEHVKQSETESTWTLKGDVGVLARVVKFQVLVEEWNGPDRVTFRLKGLNEPMEGSGSFSLSSYEDASAAVETPAAPSVRKGLFRRLIEAILRLLFRLRHGHVKRAETADAGPGQGMSRLTFKLTLNPGGPMAPMVNALMEPAMIPAAEDLANKIMAHLEKQHGAESDA